MLHYQMKKLISYSSLQVHSLICTELLKLVDSVSKIFPEIEAARPRCLSGIQALCLLNSAFEKTKLLIQYCSESSKLYLVGKLQFDIKDPMTIFYWYHTCNHHCSLKTYIIIIHRCVLFF